MLKIEQLAFLLFNFPSKVGAYFLDSPFFLPPPQSSPIQVPSFSIWTFMFERPSLTPWNFWWTLSAIISLLLYTLSFAKKELGSWPKVSYLDSFFPETVSLEKNVQTKIVEAKYSRIKLLDLFALLFKSFGFWVPINLILVLKIRRVLYLSLLPSSLLIETAQVSITYDDDVLPNKIVSQGKPLNVQLADHSPFSFSRSF